MTYWWNEIGDRISLFNLADICPKAWFFRQSAKYRHRQMHGIVCKFSCNICVCVQYALHFLFLTYGKYLFCQCPSLESLDAPFADISSANEYKYR